MNLERSKITERKIKKEKYCIKFKTARDVMIFLKAEWPKAGFSNLYLGDEKILVGMMEIFAHEKAAELRSAGEK